MRVSAARPITFPPILGDSGELPVVAGRTEDFFVVAQGGYVMHVLEGRNVPVRFDGIEEAATGCLLRSPYHGVRTVSCQHDHGTLFLRGRLASFHQKQVAQEAVARVKGVAQVVNDIEVD